MTSAAEDRDAPATGAIQHIAEARALAAAGDERAAAMRFDEAASWAKYEHRGTLHAEAIANAGVHWHRCGDSAAALERCRAASAMFRDLGDRRSAGLCEANIAVILRDGGLRQEAAAALGRAEALLEGSEDLATVDLLRAEFARDPGPDATDATDEAALETALEAALEAARHSGDELLTGRRFEQLAALRVERRGPAAALGDCFASFSHYVAIGDLPGRYRATLQLVSVYQQLGRWPDALRALTDAITLAGHLGAEHDLGLLHAGVAATRFAMGQFPQASADAAVAVGAYRRTGDRAGLGRALVTLGQCHDRIGDPHAAIVAWQEASALLAGIDPEAAAVAAELLGGAGVTR